MKYQLMIKKNFNLATFFFHYLKRSLKLPYPPFFFWIEPTNACNLKCVSCPHSLTEKMPTKKGFMSMELCRKLIDEIRSFKPRGITFHLGGESMLHPNLFKMIQLAKNSNITTMMSTNATLLTEAKAEALIDSGLDALRIDFCHDKNYFENFRKGADWNLVLENIRRLLKFKKKKDSRSPTVHIVNIMMDNSVSFSKLKDLFQDLDVIGITAFKTHTWAGEFADIMVDNSLLRVSKKSYFPCSHLWSSLAIKWDGKVVPCCRDLKGDYIVGDAVRSSLLEIWNGDRLMNLRYRLKTKDLARTPLCRNCSKIWEGKPYHLILKHISTSWKLR